MEITSEGYTHTHTHTHTYIYIYIYIKEKKEEGNDKGWKKKKNLTNMGDTYP